MGLSGWMSSHQFRGIPQLWEPFSPSPPGGALTLLSGHKGERLS